MSGTKLTLDESVPSLPADLVGREGRVEREIVQLRVFSLGGGDLCSRKAAVESVR